MSIAMEPDYRIKRGDTLSELTATLRDGSGNPVPLDGATVTFRMRDFTSGQVLVSGAATIVAPTAGQVRYTWQVADTDEAGYFYAEWEVVYGSGGKQTFPTHGYHLIIIVDDLDSPELSPEEFADVRRLRTMVAETSQDHYSDAMLAAYLARNDGDLAATAAEIWREKAAEYAGLVDVTNAGSARKLSQLYDRAVKQAVEYDASSAGGASSGNVVIHDIVR